MQFPSRFGRRLLLFFGIPVACLLFLLAVSAWFSLTLTPLQKIYFGPYAASTLGARVAGNWTTIWWVMKTSRSGNWKSQRRRKWCLVGPRNCQPASRRKRWQPAGGD